MPSAGNNKLHNQRGSVISSKRIMIELLVRVWTEMWDTWRGGGSEHRLLQTSILQKLSQTTGGGELFSTIYSIVMCMCHFTLITEDYNRQFISLLLH